MFFLLERDAARREETFFSERVAEAQAAIRVRVTHYIDALLSSASHFTSSPPIDRESWRNYTDSLDLRKRYPGINGLGVIMAVPPAEVEAWKARVRITGEPDPKIVPFPGTTESAADDPAKYLITLVESVGDRPPIGRNIATDPSRRRAAELARDTGSPTINQRIPGSRDTQRRAGLLLYVPLYRREMPRETVAQRRAAHLGWAYAQVFPDIFLDGVLEPMGGRLHLHFFEAGGLSREKLLYASTDAAAERLPKFEQVTQITLANQQFQLGWRRGPRFPVVERSSAKWVAGSMGVATLLLAGLVLSLQSVGRRAHAIATARTAELGASEERFRQAFDLAGIGMAIIALDGQLLRVNPALCDIVGYPEARLLQKKIQDITHPDDLAAALSLRDELIAGKRRFYQIEKRYLHRDGHGVWVRLTASLVRDAHGEPMHTIVQVEDIGERRRLEATVAGSRDRAIEDSRFKTDFLATIVYQIRAPANELISIATRLRNRLVGPEQADFVAALEASGDAFLKVLSNILDYWNLEFNRVELEHQLFNLRECVNGALESFESEAREKRLKLELAIASGSPVLVAGDARRLRQILASLLGSAIKFTDAGEVRLTLTAEPLDATTGRQRLKFAVRDTGSGIAANAAFHSGGALELAIAKRLTELMGGTLWTESEPGRGTTFHFTVSVEPR
ncbi:MAG TPA: CHASE domain-containing protein [Opitutaceae bacterium]|nr:CHASE domain-containing protein [Opitutaceae bacterium]